MSEKRVVMPEASADDLDADFANGGTRPLRFDDFIGQRPVCDNLKVFIQAARGRGEAMDHVLFHGPPGLGKTTLAQIVAYELGVGFRATSGPVIAKAGDLAAILTNLEPNDVLFIDEIHRFSKSQQDSLLGAVEAGTVTLIGATTENPSFEVIPALRSRCQTYVLESLSTDALMGLVARALA